MRRVLKGLAGVILTILWSSAMIAPSAAECGALDPWPSFESAVRTANRVVIGEVIEDRDPNSSHYLSVFGLRLDDVLRGEGAPGDVIEISYLRSGLPTQVCSDSHLWVLPGDEIALALDARGPSGLRGINSVAWVAGTPDVMQRGVERLSLDEIHHLAALPMTDSGGVRPTQDARGGQLAIGEIGLPLILGASAVVLQLWSMRRRQSEHEHRKQ